MITPEIAQDFLERGYLEQYSSQFPGAWAHDEFTTQIQIPGLHELILAAMGDGEAPPTDPTPITDPEPITTPTIQLPPRAGDGTANVTINGEVVSFPGGTGPVVQDARTLVPVRGVFEHLGFEVVWEPDGAVNTVLIYNDTHSIRMVLGSDIFYVNGTAAAQRLDVPAQLVGARTMIPIRLPLEAVGLNIGWDDATRTVLIYN
jgi:hypothetical protein